MIYCAIIALPHLVHHIINACTPTRPHMCILTNTQVATSQGPSPQWQAGEPITVITEDKSHYTEVVEISSFKLDKAVSWHKTRRERGSESTKHVWWGKKIIFLPLLKKVSRNAWNESGWRRTCSGVAALKLRCVKPLRLQNTLAASARSRHLIMKSRFPHRKYLCAHATLSVCRIHRSGICDVKTPSTQRPRNYKPTSIHSTSADKKQQSLTAERKQEK